MTTRKLVFLACAATFSLTLVSCGEAEPDSGLSETDASESPAETSSAEEDEVSGSVQSEIPETSVGEEHMSLPTGALHYEDPGFELSVFQAAQAMIANSDNTATDLLIDHLGRSFIEQSIQEAGRYSPELLQPLLTTREVFQLRWGHEDLGEEFVDASPARQQEILDELAEMPLEISSPDMVPDEGAAYGLEWYGSAEDIAAVHESLHSSRGAHPDLRHILGDHQDLLSEDPWWTTHSYKGGNTQGVFSGSWRVEGTDGTTRIVVLQVSGTPQDVTPLELEYTSIAQSALELEPLD